MNREKSQFALVVLTFIGMVGLYIGLYMAYQKYQAIKSQGTVGGLLGLLLSGPSSQ